MDQATWGRVGGAEIWLGPRILAAADTYDALTSDRPYRKGLSVEESREESSSRTGSQFDPDVAWAFLAGLPTWTEASPAFRL